MNVQIIETGKREILSIIDPQSGCDWIQDIMGNYGALPCYNDEIDAYEMSQGCYDWWADLTARYEKADHRMHDLRKAADDADEFSAAWEAYNTANDLDDMPGMMDLFCDQWVADNA